METAHNTDNKANQNCEEKPGKVSRQRDRQTDKERGGKSNGGGRGHGQQADVGSAVATVADCMAATNSGECVACHNTSNDTTTIADLP
mmetsp:Transcript_51051/g.128101  ORF Transcript_51051/g.128101 Transcript_51051/m.128101 type:complete len:88 (-) Transcript_51051:1184-1447(-)